MATVNSTSTLTGLFKEVYGSSVIDLAKSTAKLSQRIKFREAEALGANFNQPLNVQLEHSIVAAATGTTPTLLTVNTGQVKNAQIAGSQLVGRSTVDYEAIAKGMNGDKAAFIQSTRHVVRNLSQSMVKRLEIQLLHGRRGIGTISSVSGSSTTRAWVITDATWSAGIWAGMVGATLDVMTAAPTGAKRNSNAAVVVVSVDIANKTVNVSGNATDLGNIVANDVIFFESCSSATEFAGLDVIARNTSTLYGIDAATYELLGGNIYSASTGVLSMAKVLEGMSLAASFGLDQDATLVVSPKAYEVLNADLAALRMFDGSYGEQKAVNGFATLKYVGQTGSLEILPHPFQKDGVAHLFCPAEAKRVGATDLTFIKRHGTNEALILESSTTAAAEMRCFSHQALFVEAPRHCVVFDGITY